MTIDPRCLIATDLGILKNGSGLSEIYVNGAGLITYRGTFVFDGVHTPARGRVIQVAYARPQYGVSGTLTRIYPRLHAMSSSVDPFVNGGNGETTVEVGCRLELMRDRKDPVNVLPRDVPPAWWTALSVDRQEVVAPTISAQSVIDYCLAALGITLASGSAVSTDEFLRRQVDLSAGYVETIDALLRSALLLGYMTPAGELLVQPLSLAAENGPVLTKNDLINLQPINNRDGAEQVTVEYDAIEADPNLGDPSIPIVGPNGESGAPLGTALRSSFDQRDWEYEITISPPSSHTLVYSDLLGEQQSVVFPHIATSEVVTRYRTLNYLDRDGKRAEQDVVFQRTNTTRGCRAEANPALGGSLLSNGFGFAGSADDLVTTVSTYQYRIGDDGPKLFRETSETYHSWLKLAGSLGIKDYVIDGIPYVPSNSPVLVSRVEVLTEANELARRTRRSTTRYTVSGKKQSGNQGSAVGAESATSASELEIVVRSAAALVNEGTEVTLTIGRQIAVQSRPSPQDRQIQPSESDVQTEPRYVTAQYFFGSTGSGVWDTASYVLPYAPDDYVYAVNGAGAGLIDSFIARGGARQRALKFGEIQNAIAFGRANGVSAVMAPWVLPSKPFATVYLDVLGVSTAFKVIGRSWEIANGMMMAVADLMLTGTAGRLTGHTPTLWTPLPVGAMTLNEIGAPSGSGDLLPANTITLPGGFNPDAPGSVWASLPTNGADTYGPNRTPSAIAPPYVQTVQILARSRSAVVVTELLYSVAPVTEDVLAVSRSRAEAREVVLVAVPLTTLTLTPQVPAVYVPVVVAVPLTTLTLTAFAPIIYTPVTVNVPLTALTLTAFAPTLNLLSAPLTTLTLTSYAPTISPASDPDFASVSLLLPLNGTNGSTTFSDASSNAQTITGLGNAQISTAQSKWGGSSLLLDETGDYLTVPNNSIMALGSGDFSIECWVRFASSPTGNSQGIYQLSSGYLNTAVRGPALGADGSGWSIYYGTTNTSGGSVPSAGVWYFTHYRRASGTITLEVDGTVVITVSNSTNYTDQHFAIGGYFSASFLLNGNLQDLRITKGLARAAGVVPTAAFPTF